VATNGSQLQLFFCGVQPTVKFQKFQCKDIVSKNKTGSNERLRSKQVMENV